jgi:hypothetical protein
MKIVSINCDEISDWKTFHACFKAAFGFPDFYGENMNAWVDCMTSLDEGFSSVQIDEGDVLTLKIENVGPFKKKCPDIYDALIECSAFVNYRRMDVGQRPVLLLAFYE